MVEIGEKRNFDIMTASELWDEIKRRKVSMTEEYSATEKILRQEGFSIDAKDHLQSPKAGTQPVQKPDSEVPETFYQRASLHEIPISPFQGGNPYPAGRYSKIGVSKMKEFISGHMKFYEKGITKQEEVEQVGIMKNFTFCSFAPAQGLVVYVSRKGPASGGPGVQCGAQFASIR